MLIAREESSASHPPSRRDKPDAHLNPSSAASFPSSLLETRDNRCQSFSRCPLMPPFPCMSLESREGCKPCRHRNTTIREHARATNHPPLTPTISPPPPPRKASGSKSRTGAIPQPRNEQGGWDDSCRCIDFATHLRTKGGRPKSLYTVQYRTVSVRLKSRPLPLSEPVHSTVQYSTYHARKRGASVTRLANRVLPPPFYKKPTSPNDRPYKT